MSTHTHTHRDLLTGKHGIRSPLRRAGLLTFVWSAVACLNGAWECNPTYEFEQYHYGSPEPWQQYFFFTNVSLPLLCEQDPWGCPGTMDQFQITAAEDKQRDRYVFFGRTGEDVGRECFRWNRFLSGQMLEDCSYRWWEPGRPGPEDEGTVTTGKVFPLGPERLVHWVRHYDRGACSVEWDRESLLTLRDLIVETFRNRMKKHWAIYSASIIWRRIDFHLGIDPVEWRNVNAENFDYVIVSAKYEVQPWCAGSWEATIQFVWRFGIGTRDAYLYCGEGHDCEDDPYLPCVTDEDCSRFVHGAVCTPGGTPEEPGRCFKGPVLALANYGIRYETESHCNSGDLVCQSYYDGFRERLAKLAHDPYYEVFVPILEGIEDSMWQEVPIIGTGCETDADCYDAARLYGLNLEWKCGPAGELNGNSGTACYVRPDHIWGVNQYPNTVEFVLAPVDDDIEYPEVRLYRLPGLCSVARAPKWSPVQRSWVHWQEWQ